MSRLRFISAAAALAGAVLCAGAQDSPRYDVFESTIPSDFQPRVDVGFEFPLADDFTFTLNNELRFRDNMTRIDRNYLQGSFSWETCDYFSLDAGYIFQSVLKEHQQKRILSFLGIVNDPRDMTGNSP